YGLRSAAKGICRKRSGSDANRRVSRSIALEQLDLVSQDRLPLSTFAEDSAGVASQGKSGGQDQLPIASEWEIRSWADQQSIDLILIGEVHSIRGSTDQHVLNWRVMQSDDGRTLGGKSVRFASSENMGQQIIEGLQMIAPHIAAKNVKLATTRFLPGSAKNRRGIELAVSGIWPDAESIWRDNVQSCSFQHASLHNLAIASIAKQDFVAAREFLGRAMRFSGRDEYKEHLVWCEQLQRYQHLALQLPDPEGGWILTR
ncbi:MAG: hypothetical protein AAFP69_09835, partial [Planctomycetota bacterium]